MIKTKPWTGGTDEEYETQHFGFGAQRLKISVRQMVEQKITNGVKDMESYLQESLDLNETDKVTLTRSCDKLIRLYCDRAGPSLEAIDDEIERVLKIPQNVLLPEDEVQLEQTSDSDFEKLKEEVASLRKRVERGALMEALLTAEEEELATVEKVCETAKKDMEAIDLLYKNVDNGECLKSIQNETQFLCASASFMKKENNIFDEEF
ncbi:unnamed protein product [Chrysodeixis includens]|uniref:Protein MIS12 homolog n=1 Tax=Chrysodeixis includens TaxID=689277 RepID=A0A9P0FR36_CHRIL|nr:unnamed protein product [Chrysodeixis includens]